MRLKYNGIRRLELYQLNYVLMKQKIKESLGIYKAWCLQTPHNLRLVLHVEVPAVVGQSGLVHIYVSRGFMTTRRLNVHMH